MIPTPRLYAARLWRGMHDNSLSFVVTCGVTAERVSKDNSNKLSVPTHETRAKRSTRLYFKNDNKIKCHVPIFKTELNVRLRVK